MSTLTYEELVKRHGDFLLGSDPEFRLRGIQARAIFPYEGKFGSDGPRSPVAELRPDPKHKPEDAVKEVESLLRFGFRTYPEARKTDWLAGSFPDGHPIGGHIHFGIPLTNSNTHILEALDRFFSPVIMMMENKEEASQRRRTDYGKLSFDHRGFDTKPYGFEYRGPASWLVSKQITKSVFALAKVIGYEFLDKKSAEHMKILIQTVDVNTQFKDAYKKCDKSYFKPLIPTIHRAIKTMKMARIYEADLNYMFSMIYQDRDWDSNKNLLDRWGVGLSTCLTTTRAKDGTLKPFRFSLTDLTNDEYRWNPVVNTFRDRFFIPQEQ